MTLAEVDYGDVQGLVRYGYAHMTESRFLLLRIKDPRAARAWLRAAPVTPATRTEPRPATALQVVLTREGLETLGVPAGVLRGFSAEFLTGLSGEESRSRRLGDMGPSSPAGWQWGGPGNVPHVMVLLYAELGRLEPWISTVTRNPWAAAFEVLPSPVPALLDGVEPFGFVDGISQPVLDWEQRRDVDGGRDVLDYGNVVALGEVLLGYPNEYGKYTDRPLIGRDDERGADLLPAADTPDMRDLGKNGSYLVMRQLRQDAQGFWQFLRRQANGDPEAGRALAEAMVGRGLTGDPLIGAGGPPIPGVDPKDADDVRYNQFTFDADVHGTRCPFGAHIRRANPRNADLPGRPAGFLGRMVRTLGFGRKDFREDAIASTRFHRILRRGREYGPWPPSEASRRAGGEDGESGLYFICLNANIARQFEFVQGAWIMGTKFGGLSEESDPLLGSRAPLPGCPVTSVFSLPQASGLRRRLTGIPQFVTVRGGAYFFLPGLRALRYLTSFGA
jgi:deferrochelatase/peroxidase EfeB